MKKRGKKLISLLVALGLVAQDAEVEHLNQPILPVRHLQKTHLRTETCLW